MARTQVRTAQIGDTEVGRNDLNTATAGQAVIRKAVAGSRIGLSSTGADTGTGDVTIDLKEHYYSALYDLTTATNVDWANGNVQKRTNSAPVTLTFANGVAGGRYALVITNSGGAQTITWPGTVKWMGGSVPTPSASGKKDIYTFLYDGTDYLGAAALNF
jgi:hypothetical protein